MGGSQKRTNYTSDWRNGRRRAASGLGITYSIGKVGLELNLDRSLGCGQAESERVGMPSQVRGSNNGRSKK